MNYKDLVLKARKESLKLTLKQQQEIANIYTDVIDDLAEKAENYGEDTLTYRWLEDYTMQIFKARSRLMDNLNGSIRDSIKQAGKNAIEPDLELFKQAQRKAGIDLGDHFTDMFSQVPDDILSIIVKGDLYRDGKGLSERIWNHTNEFGQDIDYIIKRAMAEKKSALELAKDLEHFVKPEHKRPWSWGKVYPNLRTKQIDYNAQRLARTSITHAHRESQYRSAARNPFVEAIHWELSPEHFTRQVSKWGEDECDEYTNQNWYNLGKGNFPVDEVPLSHPQCLCFTYPVIPKSLDEIADELKAWEQGENNSKLDKWYNEYGDYFNGLNKEKHGIIRQDKTGREQSLDTIKQQKWAKAIKEKDKAELFRYFEKATDKELTFWANYGDLVEGEFYDPRNRGFYNPATKEVNLNISMIDERSRRIGDTKDNRLFFHETGHLFDDNVLRKTKNIRIADDLTELRNKLEEDYLNYANKVLKDKGLKELKSLARLSKEQKETLNDDLRKDIDLKNAISDILEGMTNGRVGGHDAGHYGHGKNYWNRTMALEKEATAHLFEAKMMKGERKEVFTKYFPNTFRYFDNYIDSLVR